MPQQANTAEVRDLVAKWQVGDQEAANDLVRLVGERLEKLTRKMLRDNRRLRRWAQTDDVFQNALMRLLRSLKTLNPPSMKDFYSLASAQLRRELIDLARHYFGPEGSAAHHSSKDAAVHAQQQSKSADPATLAQWTEFHQKIEELPAKEREIFDFLYYQGLTQARTAEELSVDVSTVQRRWALAQAKLQKLLKAAMPGA